MCHLYLRSVVSSELRQRIASPFSVVSPGRTNGQCTQIPAPINQDLKVMIGNHGNHVRLQNSNVRFLQQLVQDFQEIQKVYCVYLKYKFLLRLKSMLGEK